MKRSIVGISRSAALVAALVLPLVAGAQANDRKPIIAILPYDNNSIGADAANYAGIQKGIAELLITDIAADGRVRVVERSRLDAIMQEQNLTRTGAVDNATAVRLGKLFNACYAVTGMFTNMSGQITMTAKMFSMETGQVDPATVRITRRGDDIMGLIDALSKEIQSKLKLAGCPTDTPRLPAPAPAQSGSAGAKATPAPAAATTSTELFAKPIDPIKMEESTKIKLDLKTALIFSKGLEALENKDPKKAVTLFTQVLAKPNEKFEPAAVALAKAKAAGG